MRGTRILVQGSLDSWSLSGHLELTYGSLAFVLFEIYGFFLFKYLRLDSLLSGAQIFTGPMSVMT